MMKRHAEIMRNDLEAEPCQQFSISRKFYVKKKKIMNKRNVIIFT